MRLLKLLLVMFVCAAGPAVAGPLEDGLLAMARSDYTTALCLLRPLAEKGNARAQHSLARIYGGEGLGIPMDFAAAAAWYRKAADQGDAESQRDLANLYFIGWGVPRDYAAAAFWYQKAAEQGDARAQERVASMYDHGMGVRKDDDAAVFWYRKAADQGDADGQRGLARMYAMGRGVPKDDAAALSWYRKAADQGDASAQDILGFKYEQGIGVPRDFAAAVAWYRKAADQGNAHGQYGLGLMYFNGQGVPKDESMAMYWWLLAAKQGNYHAERGLKELAEKAPNTAPNSGPAQPPQMRTSSLSIQMKKEGDVYAVPVLINNVITLDFTVDSGASDVTIPEDVVSTLIRTGTIRDTDFIGEKTYVLADGSRVKSKTFRIRSLKVGDRVLENVAGSVAAAKGSLLLGQSFLGRFKSWSIDNSAHALLLE